MTTTSSSTLKILKICCFAGGWGLPMATLFLILFNFPAGDLKLNSEVWDGLVTGTHTGYQIPGSELAELKPILPRQGPIVFLMDTPYPQDIQQTEKYHDFQNFLCPLVLNPRPEEPAGLIYASSDAVAVKRLEATGYQMILPLAEGKGIIRKQ